jgi:peptidoglycan/LPS O-acetylase OafA/YrhL
MPSDRLRALDGFRGLAILAVFLYHVAFFGGAPPHSPLDRGLVRLVLTGWIGVDLFFVLSGFLITGILLDSRDRPGWLKQFYWRRLLRIVPAYYLAMGVQVAILAWNGQADSARLGWTATWLTNILVAREGWDSVARSMHHFWSLAVEEQFYLLWPLVVAVLPRPALRWTCGLLVVAASVIRVVLVQKGFLTASYTLLPGHMDGLAVGGFLACQVREPGGLAAAARACRLPALVAGLMLAAIGVLRGRLVYGDPYMLAFGLNALMVLAGCLMIIGAARPEGLLGRFLELRGLRALGKYSYALYLWHQPIILALAGAGIGAAVGARLGGGVLVQLTVLGLAAAVLTLAVALLSWRLVEAPALRLKDRALDVATVPPAP